MIPAIKLGALSVIAVGFFLAGHFYGSYSVPDTRSAAEKAVALKKEMQFKDLVRNSVFDQFLKTSDLDSLEKAANLAQGWPVANTMTKELLVSRQKDVQELKRLVLQVIEQAKSSMKESKYQKARKSLDLLAESTTLTHDRLEDALFAAAGQWDTNAAPVGKTEAKPFTGVDARAAPMSPSGEIIVDVQPGPFGMHVKRGSTTVSEVFPGSAAQRAGIKPGCKIISVGGLPVSAGSWLQIFQGQRNKAKHGFKIQLNCLAQPVEAETTTPAATAKKFRQPVKDPHRKPVMMLKKPFGMNIQVWKLPRVVQVLPGSFAEKAGVKVGYVLTEVQGKPVDVQKFQAAIDECKPPCKLMFDTDVPVHEGNPFVAGASAIHDKNHPDVHNTEDYKELKFEVTSLPFGAQIKAPMGGLPYVADVTPGFAAEKLGVQVDDILTEVAGREVNSTSWFAAFQMARPPFGVRFKRPLDHIKMQHGDTDFLPAPPPV